MSSSGRHHTHYLVVDLEATTPIDKAVRETIEIGAVVVDARTLGVLDEYQTFIRPVRRPVLDQFCIELTSITQADVAAAPTFLAAIRSFETFIAEHRRPAMLFCSWGNFDRHQLEQDCTHHQVPYAMPEHLNLKTEFARVQGRRRHCGMAAALRLCGLALEGAHHRGIDDARNIARMLPWIVGDARLQHDQRGLRR